MVKVLPDHFPQITLAIICIAWSVGHKIYYRNFLPSQQTKLITGIQESIILWIMGDTDIIAAHFLQQTDVATVRGYTYRCLILMTVETTQLVRLPIQTESLLAIEWKPAESYLMGFLVNGFSCFVSTSEVTTLYNISVSGVQSSELLMSLDCNSMRLVSPAFRVTFSWKFARVFHQAQTVHSWPQKLMVLASRWAMTGITIIELVNAVRNYLLNKQLSNVLKVKMYSVAHCS